MSALPGILLLTALVTTLGCKRSPPEPSHSRPATVASSAPPPVLHLPPGSPGEWVESKRYRLRVLDVWPCDEPRSESGTTPVNELRTVRSSGTFRLGVTIEIEAKPNQDSPVFASPRAVVLERYGKIFQTVSDPEPTPACRTLLEPKRLAPGQSTRGVLVFEAPNADYLRSAVLQFKPPRWGREYRTDVALPDCFGKGCG
jgi:hypothetical protein